MGANDQITPIFTLAVVIIVMIAVFFRALLKFKFSLRDLFISVIAGAACVTMILGSGDPLLITGGVFGLVLLFAFIASAVGRANTEEESSGEPPHGSDTDG
jgi:hypothetical protein